jgi:SulP family sulfate permease
VINNIQKEPLFIFPIRKDLKSYSLKTFYSDLFSALTVAMLALPQSLAYSLVAGLPPQAGIFAAIFGTIFTASFGSSRHLISGPTNATAILIQTAVATILNTHFKDISDELRLTLSLQIITQMVFLIGVVQIIFGSLQLGRLTQFISRSVIMGYILGVALTIIIGQTFHFLGLEKPVGASTLFAKVGYLVAHIPKIDPIITTMASFSLFVLFFLKRLSHKLPKALLMTILISLLAHFLIPKGHLKYIQGVSLETQNLLGGHFVLFDLPILKSMIPHIFAIALFSIIEVNSVTRIISAKSGQMLFINQDIFGLGIANVISSFFLGVLPSSGSPSRSILNFQNGGKTRFSAIFSGVFLGLIVFSFHPLLNYIPICALASLLIMIAIDIIDFKLLKICFKSTKRDAFVMLVTCLSCLFFELDMALYIGVTLSLILYLRLAAIPHLFEHGLDDHHNLKPILSPKDRSVPQIRIINMEGNLFFGSVDILYRTLSNIASNTQVKIIILRLNNTYHLDASTCYILRVLAEDLKKMDKKLILCDVINPIMKILERSSVARKIGEKNLFKSDPLLPNLSITQAYQKAQESLNLDRPITSPKI